MKSMSRVFIILVFVLLYAPILVSLVFSFNASDSYGVFTGFSLKWYRTMFNDEAAFDALKNTLILAVASSFFSTLLGTAAAIGIYNIRNKRFKKVIMSVTNIPMMSPEIVTGVSMMLLFASAVTLFKLELFGFWTVLIAHITFNIPYVILCVMPKLKQMDKNLPEAAMDLGCSPLKAFYKVELFELLPGIATGMLMAFTLSLDDFVISYFVAGPTFQTLPIYIYSQTKIRVSPSINALFALIFVVVFVFLLLRNILTKDTETTDRSKVAKQRR